MQDQILCTSLGREVAYQHEKKMLHANGEYKSRSDTLSTDAQSSINVRQKYDLIGHIDMKSIVRLSR